MKKENGNKKRIFSLLTAVFLSASLLLYSATPIFAQEPESISYPDSSSATGGQSESEGQGTSESEDASESQGSLGGQSESEGQGTLEGEDASETQGSLGGQSESEDQGILEGEDALESQGSLGGQSSAEEGQTPEEETSSLSGTNTVEETADSSAEENTDGQEPPLANSIEGFVWLDSNDDGIFGEDEALIAEYPVQLYKADDLAAEAAEATTDANGAYSFDQLEPGSYIVCVRPANIAGEDYALPAAGRVNDNLFAVDENTADRALTDALEVAGDTVISNVNAGLSLAPMIMPMATSGNYIVTNNGAEIGRYADLQGAVGACNQPGAAYTITLTENDPNVGDCVIIEDYQNITLTSENITRTITQQNPDTRHISIKGTLTLLNIVLDGMQAGGGVLISDDGKLTMGIDASINNCSATHGGGVYLKDNAIFTMEGNATIENCEAQESGGGVYLKDSATFTMEGNATINGCKEAEYGGGAFVYGEAVMEMGGHSSIQSCSATYGGGIHIAKDSSNSSPGLFMHDYATITDCKAEESGGGVSADGGTVQIAGDYTTISYCHALNGGGGGLFVGTGATATLMAGVINNNTAASDGGGVLVYRVNPADGFETVFIMLGGKVIENAAGNIGGGIGVLGPKASCRMEGGTVYNNFADVGGGVGVANDEDLAGIVDISVGADFIMTSDGAQILQNKATYGGGVYAEIGSTITVQNGATIVENEASEYGGGVCVNEKSRLTMTGGVIQTNTAAKDGGGVFLYSGSSLVMEGGMLSSILDNKATGDEGEGGGICAAKESDIEIWDGSIQNNAAYYGGGIYLSADSNLWMESGKIHNNTADEDGGGIFTEDHSYHNPADISKYANLSISSEVTFNGNTAVSSYYPPKNYTNFSNFNGAFLTNGDINYRIEYEHYPVTYQPNNGTSEEEYVQDIQTTGPPPDSFTTELVGDTGFTPPANKHFAGWNTQADGRGTSYEPDVTYDYVAELTLYAIWETDMVTVRFDANGGQTTAHDLTGMPVDGAIGTLPNATREGYTFMGWYTAPQDGKQADGTSSPLDLNAALKNGGTLTLYAHWEDPKLSTDKDTYARGETVMVTGSGFIPDTDVVLTLHNIEVVVIHSDSAGKITGSFIVPAEMATGTLTLVAKDGKNTAGCTILITAGPAGGTSPQTGDAGGLGLWVMLAALSGLMLSALRIFTYQNKKTKQK